MSFNLYYRTEVEMKIIKVGFFPSKENLSLGLLALSDRKIKYFLVPDK